jgi:hypothetical protein
MVPEEEEHDPIEVAREIWKGRDPEEMVSDLYRRFRGEYAAAFRESLGVRPTEEHLISTLLSHLYAELVCRHPSREREISQLFAPFAPKGRREQQRANARQLAWQYGFQGKPPKLRFARWAANLNASMIDNGYPGELLGSGTTDVENMHHYLKEVLKQKKYRDLADIANQHGREKIPRKIS